MEFSVQRLLEKIDSDFLREFEQALGVDFYRALAEHKTNINRNRSHWSEFPKYCEYCELLQSTVVAVLTRLGKLHVLPATPLLARKKPSQVDEFISELIFPSRLVREQINEIRGYFLAHLKNGTLVDQVFGKLQQFLEVFWHIYKKPVFQLVVDNQLNQGQIRKALTSFKRVLAIGKQIVQREFSYRLSNSLKYKITAALSELRPDEQQWKHLLQHKWIGPKGWRCLRQLPLSEAEFKGLFQRLDRAILGRRKQIDSVQAKQKKSYLRIKAEYLSQFREKRQPVERASGQQPECQFWVLQPSVVEVLPGFYNIIYPL